MDSVYSKRKKEGLWWMSPNRRVGLGGRSEGCSEQIPFKQQQAPSCKERSFQRGPGLQRTALTWGHALTGQPVYGPWRGQWGGNKSPSIWQPVWPLRSLSRAPPGLAKALSSLHHSSVSPAAQSCFCSQVWIPDKHLIPQALSQHLLQRTTPATKVLHLP